MNYAEQLASIILVAFSIITWQIARAIAIENKGPRVPVNPDYPSWPVNHSTMKPAEEVYPKATFE